MIRVALKGLLGRKLRAVLTALAIVLGVAMISGTYVLTDTISKAFDTLFTDSYRNTSAVITGKKIVDFSESGSATVQASLLARVRALPDVEAAVGGITDQAKLIDPSGKVIDTLGAPSLAFSIDTSDLRFNPLTLTDGRWPAGPGEIAIDKGTAGKRHIRLGDRIGVAARGPVRQFTVSGIARFGTVDSIGSATLALFDVPTAQRLFGKAGQFDGISLAARPGVSPERLVREIRPLLSPTAQVRTAASQAKSASKDTQDALKIFRYFLLAFGGVALFVGAFVIFNTLSITVAQRAREFATLRTLGAMRRQVLRSVVLEALAIGVFASVVGLFLGLALAKGLNAVFVSFGLNLPQKGLVFATRTIVVSLAVGTGITLVAGLAPAFRATRVPPISAVREGAVLPRTRLAPYAPAFAALMAAIAIAALVAGGFVGGIATGLRLALLGGGCLVLFVAVAILSARLVRPVASVVGRPAERLGGFAGRLARENATRNPGRTAVTAASLMIGLALVTLVATLGQGLRTSQRSAIERQVGADYVVSTDGTFDNFAVAGAVAAARAPGVAVASAVREDRARAFGKSVNVSGIDPATILPVYRFFWKQGSDATLAELGLGGALVKAGFARSHHLKLGGAFSLTTPAGRRLRFVVVGTHEPPKLDSMLGAVTISNAAFDRGFPRPKDHLALLNLRGGATPAATRALERALAPYPDAKVRSKRAFVDKRSSGIVQFLNLLYVLLALSVIVSLFGMVNTLVLSVFERTRELGMLRAVGMTRRQTRRMVRHESVITALIGAALGLPLGVGLAALVTAALRGQGVVFALPARQLVVFAIVAVWAGILAAILPARRAARLNVLEALQYE